MMHVDQQHASRLAAPRNFPIAILSIPRLYTRQIRGAGDHGIMSDSDEDSEYDTDESELAACWDSHDDLSSEEGQQRHQYKLYCARAIFLFCSTEL